MEISRKKKFTYNTISSLLLQITQVICGFILPRLILSSFSSVVNGLVNSITQFLGVISLLDLGLGAVVESSLYKPLAERDWDTISQVYISATKFFKRLAIVLLGYIVVLMCVYPAITYSDFDHIYTATLIAAIGISSFAQYYFGIVNAILLTSDQKGYIQYTTQMIAIVLNTVLCAFLIKIGSSIQIVKLTTSLIFLCRPLCLERYVRKHYDLRRKIKYVKEPIKQKWNGIAQHLSWYVLTSTDNILLTLFSTLSNVSIYSVYHSVVNSVFMLVSALSNGVSPYFGNLLAQKDTEKLKVEFQFFEWMFNAVTIAVFGCTGSLIVDFVRVYTNGVHDANYIQPIFGFVLTTAFAMRALRISYNFLILAAGHYKQTQNNYIIAMLMNIILSIMTVKLYGLVGVAIGTLVAMGYQTVWLANYSYKNIVYLPVRRFLKLITMDVVIYIVGFVCTVYISMGDVSYSGWFIRAVLVFGIWIVIDLGINSIFYMSEMKAFWTYFKKKVFRIRN